MIEQRAKTAVTVALAALASGTVGAAASGQCQLTCPPGSSAESELCGDDTNGGCCCEGIPAFEPIACDETVCGTSWGDGGFRDTDWYELVITEPTRVTIHGTAEFNLVLGLGNNHGDDNCDNYDYYYWGGHYVVEDACVKGTATACDSEVLVRFFTSPRLKTDGLF